jgi:hypothetical protein
MPQLGFKLKTLDSSDRRQQAPRPRAHRGMFVNPIPSVLSLINSTNKCVTAQNRDLLHAKLKLGLFSFTSFIKDQLLFLFLLFLSLL